MFRMCLGEETSRINCAPALNPVTNQIYVAFGHCNHGWLLAYDKTSLKRTAIFNDTPNAAGGGLRNGGGPVTMISAEMSSS